MSGSAATAATPRRAAQRLGHRVERVVGGPARTRAVVLLACVLGLENAAATAVGAAAPQLERSLHISSAQLGLLAAISTLVGAVVTVPAGALTDRARRVSLLVAVVASRGLAMAAARGGQSRLQPGDEHIVDEKAASEGNGTRVADDEPESSSNGLATRRRSYATDVATAIASERVTNAS